MIIQAAAADAAPLYTFQNVAGEFVDVMARAEYAGDTLDITRVERPNGPEFIVSGTRSPRARFYTMAAAWDVFTFERLAKLAAKFGQFEVA